MISYEIKYETEDGKSGTIHNSVKYKGKEFSLVQPFNELNPKENLFSPQQVIINSLWFALYLDERGKLDEYQEKVWTVGEDKIEPYKQKAKELLNL